MADKTVLSVGDQYTFDKAVYGVDFTNSSPQLNLLSDLDITLTTARGGIEALDGSFVFAYYFSTEGYWFYRTDGTVAGTEYIGDIKVWDGRPIGGADTWFDGFHRLAKYLIFVLSDERMIILDPTTDQLQLVSSELGYHVDDIQSVVMGNTLYYEGMDSTLNQTLFGFTITNQFVTGRTYRDLNVNNLRDPGEPALAGVRGTNGQGATAFSNKQGRFTLPVDSGLVYTISVDAPPCFRPTGNTTETITFEPNETYDLDFGFAPVSGEARISQFISAGTLRCGFTVPGLVHRKE